MPRRLHCWESVKERYDATSVEPTELAVLLSTSGSVSIHSARPWPSAYEHKTQRDDKLTALQMERGASMGYLRKGLMIGTFGAPRLVGMRANSKKDRTAKATEGMLKHQRQQAKGPGRGAGIPTATAGASKADSRVGLAFLTAIALVTLWIVVAILLLVVLAVAVPFRLVIHRSERTATEVSLRSALSSLGQGMKRQWSVAQGTGAVMTASAPSQTRTVILAHGPTVPHVPNPVGARSLGPANQLAVADELKKLADLRDAGILTEQEFQMQKEKWLS